MRVELISKSIGANSYEDLSGEEIISAVARHGKVKEDNGKLIAYLIKNKHWSPLQHIFFGFKIETSRAISAQIFRHRSLNFQEKSQRYEEIPTYQEIQLRMEDVVNRQSSKNVFDPFLYGNKKASEEIEKYLKYGQNVYKSLIDAGVARECARMILPMASTTTIHVSGTLRDLLGFLNVRCDEHTQLECRMIAIAMGEAIEKELPDMMKNIQWDNGMFM